MNTSPTLLLAFSMSIILNISILLSTLYIEGEGEGEDQPIFDITHYAINTLLSTYYIHLNHYTI